MEVDLSSGNMKETRFDEALLKDYLGGRGLAAKILCDRLIDKWEETDPLGAENVLVFLSGPLN